MAKKLAALFLAVLMAFSCLSVLASDAKKTYKTDEITAPTRVVTLVNVNTATAEELETLTGIGPSLARAIIDYRAEHGDFTAAEDLLNVKGIGEAKLEGFRAEITFTEEDGNENSGG